MSTESTTPIFALDIGTRSVVGLLLQNQNNKYQIVDMEIIEHSERSMLDGQIHNVVAVSEVIAKIKEKLEAKHGPLKKVCVAAAGRSLKTRRGKITTDRIGKTVFDRNDILHLELSAVQQAQYDLATEGEKSYHYYCVGYSVVEYTLDGDRIGSLVDQVGNHASVEVIATFLPKVVVESLISALTRTELELEALTLEPIAAINVLIPASMRRLNVALVDIGAGTSDIAITDDSTVIAYGMVPIAGDEVTEAISDQYLLDFPEAEKVKRQLSSEDKIVFTDILGFETTIESNEVLKPILETIEKLAQAITEEILALNQHSPKAVMLIGGGSMTPKIAEYIAKYLNLPLNRVAIRGIDAIQMLEQNKELSTSPELVTPIGIAIAAKESPIEYINILVNERVIRLFDVKKLTVGDGLLAAGIEVSKLYGRPGLAKMITINEKLITIPGKHGKPPLLLKNGQPTTLDASIQTNDTIVVEKGVDGRSADCTLRDVLKELPKLSLTINGKQVEVEATITKNGQPALMEEKIEERDSIHVQIPTTIEKVLSSLHYEQQLKDAKEFDIYLGEKKVSLPPKLNILKNNQLSDLSSTVNSNDIIEFVPTNIDTPSLAELINKVKIQVNQSITVLFNNSPITVSKQIVDFIRNGERLDFKDTLNRGDRLAIRVNKNESFILQDLFREVELDTSVQSNHKLIIQVNGKDATFTSPIQTGDRVIVTWVER